MSGRVLYLQYANPGGYPPLEHSAHVLADAGFDVVMLGLDAHEGKLCIRPHPRIQVVLMPFCKPGIRQKLHYARFGLLALRWVLQWRPTWIYASDALSCPLVLMLKALGGGRTIYHEHDSPVPSPGRESRFVRMVMWARTAVARRADLCILPNQGRADAFRHSTGRADVVSVWNTPALAEVSPSRVRHQHELRVWYHGSVVPSRPPLTIIDAIARLPETVTLTVAGYATVGHPGYLDELAGRAAALGIAGRVHFPGTMARQDLMERCGGYDVGLALMSMQRSDVNSLAMVGASNKPFDYFAGGLAVLVSDLPDWRDAYVTPGFGLSCDPDSVDSITQGLRWFLEHPTETAAMGARARDKILSDWNYEASFAPVLARMLRMSPVSVPGAALGRSARAQASAPAGRDR